MSAPPITGTFLEHVLVALLPWIPLVPAVAALATALLAVFERKLTERSVHAIAFYATVIGTVCTLAADLVWFLNGHPALDVHLGDWFSVGDYHFALAFYVDALTLVMLTTTAVITSLVARFSVHYLHREPGFARFFTLLHVFTAGMQLLVLAGSYDLLFIGWELVGISSVLLIAFFAQRRGPTAAGIRAMITYRVTDAGLLVAGVLFHHIAGTNDFTDAFPRLHEASPQLLVLTGIALLVSAAGKSALFPVGGWLPRAMEGPTPSSALFYGALSVHAGIYLLLRSRPLIELAPAVSVTLIVLGALTAVHATLVGRTESNAKGALAYATATQVGVMLICIGLHFWTLTLVLMVAHAFARTVQLLRAPSALADAQVTRAVLEALPPSKPSLIARLMPQPVLVRLYALASNRFHVDSVIERYVVRPVIGLAQILNRLERGWANLLSGLRDP